MDERRVRLNAWRERLSGFAGETLERYRVTRVARLTAAGFAAHDASRTAGSMAYFLTLSLFQVLVLGILGLSFFLGDGPARDFVITQTASLTPLDPGSVEGVIEAIVNARGDLGLVSLVTLVWSALGAFGALERGVAGTFVEDPRRSFWGEKVMGLVLVAVTGTMALLALALGLIFDIVAQFAPATVAATPAGGLMLGLIGLAVPAVLIFLVFLVVYQVVPNHRVSVADAWVGALIATVLWTILRVFFTFFATRIARYDTAFGPISTGITLIVFLYFASLVVLLGAEVARAWTLERRARYITGSGSRPV